MAELLQIHPKDPQLRLVRHAVDVVRSGGVIAYPTDSCYALGWLMGDKDSLERVRRIRGLGKTHQFTLVCRDLSELASYARVDNVAYRFMRARTPGPYTFILRATREVPKRLQDPRRKTIGIRVPDHPVPQLLLEVLGEPLMSSTLQLPEDDMPLSDPVEIDEKLGAQIDAILDAGNCGLESTTVVDLVGGTPRIVRVGQGEVTSMT